jgi:hypothetical protein
MRTFVRKRDPVETCPDEEAASFDETVLGAVLGCGSAFLFFKPRVEVGQFVANRLPHLDERGTAADDAKFFEVAGREGAVDGSAARLGVD